MRDTYADTDRTNLAVLQAQGARTGHHFARDTEAEDAADRTGATLSGRARAQRFGAHLQPDVRGRPTVRGGDQYPGARRGEGKFYSQGPESPHGRRRGAGDGRSAEGRNDTRRLGA